MRDLVFLRFCAIALAVLGPLAACSDKSADRDKDGEISGDERAIAAGIKQLTPMKPGLWKVEVKFNRAEIDGFSEGKKQELLAKMSKAASSSRCLSKYDAINPPASLYGGSGAGKCRYRSFDVSAGKTDIAISCVRDNLATLDTDLSGSSSDTNFSFAAKSALRLPMIGQINLSGTAAGTYAGECGTK